MLALKIVGVIVGLLVFVLLVVLISSVHIVFFAGSDREFSVGVRFWGMLFGTQTETKNPIVRFLQRLISRENPQESSAETPEKTNAFFSLKQNANMLFPLLERVFDVLKHCRISRCRIRYVSGGENAAMEYGEACSVIYPLVGYWQNCKRLKKRNTQVDLGWDYESETGCFDLEIAVSVRVAIVLLAALLFFADYKKRKEAVE